jgi:hypothetical protein
MRNHLKGTIAEASSDYSLLFREMFCVAARALADSMNLPFENLGVLFDRILETGHRPSQRTSTSPSSQFGRGQFLFLIKHASRAETAHFLASGYRFGEPHNVIATVARAMQVNRSYIEHELEMMREYCGPQRVFKPGVHIGFCDMRLNVQKGFSIAVRRNQSHAIPSIQLPLLSLNPDQESFLKTFAGKDLNAILKELQASLGTTLDYGMQTFRSIFN